MESYCEVFMIDLDVEELEFESNWYGIWDGLKQDYIHVFYADNKECAMRTFLTVCGQVPRKLLDDYFLKPVRLEGFKNEKGEKIHITSDYILDYFDLS